MLLPAQRMTARKRAIVLHRAALCSLMLLPCRNRGMQLADIFLSYAHADRPRAEALAAALEGQGNGVWWDRHIESGSQFSHEIEQRLAEAKAVIVCWSTDGSESRWVRDEANVAAEQDKLLAISLDGSDPPIGFRQYHAVSLEGWLAGDPLPAELRNALARKLGEEPSATPSAAEAPPTRKNRTFLIAAIAAFLAAIGAVLIPKLIDGDASEQMAEQSSIAVLPFEALSDDESDQYFGRGIAEELLNALAKFPDLKVAGRSSAFSFEDSDAPGNEIGEQLGVNHILQGSVRRVDDRVRVTAQLTSAATGEQLWSETYERQLTDIFAIQDEIVSQLSRVLQFRLGVGAGAGRAEAQGVDPRAYEAYLRGLDLWWRRASRSNRDGALRAFHEATRLDPKFADAWSALGMAIALSGSAYLEGWGPDFTVQAGDSALDRALSLEADNIRASAVLAIWRTSPVESEPHIERALNSAPNDAFVNYAAGLHNAWKGDLEQAVRYYDRALQLDPLNQSVLRIRAHAQSGLMRFGDMEILAAGIMDCLPAECTIDQSVGVANILTAVLHGGDLSAVKVWRDYMLEIRRHAPFPDEANRIWIDWLVGYADEILGEGKLDAHIPDGLHFSIGIGNAVPASLLARSGNLDQALDHLEIGFAERDVFGPGDDYSLLDGRLQMPENLRRHPRYHALWQQDGFAELAEVRRANGQAAGLPLPIE